MSTERQRIIAVAVSSCLITTALLNGKQIIKWMGEYLKPSTNEYGHNMLKYFNLDPSESCYYFNIGALGIVPSPIITKQQEMLSEIEKSPSKYFRTKRDDEVIETLKSMAEYLTVKDWNDLIFIDNVSQGQSIVFHSLLLNWNNHKKRLNSDHSVIRILTFNTTYSTIQNTINVIKNSDENKDKIEQIVFNVTFEMLTNTKLLLDELELFLNDYKEIDIAFISHIPSIICTIYDIKSIIKLLHDKYGADNIITCIDAAHSLGHIDVDINDINPDIYIMNGYKWFYSPRSSGLMYVNKRLQNNFIYPLIIADRYKRANTFHLKFSYVGLKDYVPWIMMKHAKEFREQIGGDDKIKKYIHDLAIKGGKRVAEIWNTKLYIDDEKYIGGMVTVLMPNDIPNSLLPWNWKEIGAKYNIWLKVNHNLFGHVVARFTTQIFHEIGDFEKTAYKILEIINNAKMSN